MSAFQNCTGEVVALFLSPPGEERTCPAETITAVAERGLEGDRHFGVPSRQALLIEAETLTHFGLYPGQVKENITVDGVILAGLPLGARLFVGDDLLLEVAGDCSPCSFIEGIRPGLRAQMEGRRGTLARVLQSGRVATGDPLRIEVPRALLLSALSGSYDRIRRLTAGADEVQLDFQQEPLSQSPRKVLMDMVRREPIWRSQVAQIIIQHDYREQAWGVETPDLTVEGSHLPVLLERFQAEREVSLNFLNGLVEDDWQAKGELPECGEFTIEDWCRHWLTEDHIAISQMKAGLRLARSAQVPRLSETTS